jgi:hypothetical protein
MTHVYELLQVPTHIAPVYDYSIDRYTAYNKPLAITHWLQNTQVQQLEAPRSSLHSPLPPNTHTCYPNTRIHQGLQVQWGWVSLLILRIL